MSADGSGRPPRARGRRGDHRRALAERGAPCARGRPPTRARSSSSRSRGPRTLETWAGPEIEGVALPGGDLVTAGASGVRHARRGDLTAGLPSRRALGARALGRASWSWRSRPGGSPSSAAAAWHELRSGWGTLHARALVEAPGGELLIGAREGLFRAAVGGTALRAARRPSGARARGRRGLRPGRRRAGASAACEPGRATFRSRRPTPGSSRSPSRATRVFAVTAVGLARGPSDGPARAGARRRSDRAGGVARRAPL